jgi:hypothetical protein
MAAAVVTISSQKQRPNPRMSSNHHQSDEESAGSVLPLPRGVLKRRGWEGEELELERTMPAASTTQQQQHAAVDLNQFRNTHVGKGYQAKHVIRQRTGKDDTAVSIRDMTKETSDPSKRKSKKRKYDSPPPFEEQKKTKTSSSTTTRLQRYLQCEGLRKFRKELESIESSTR